MSPAADSRPSRDLVSPWVQLRSISNHPFIYRKMVRETDPAARPGDVVQVYDRDGHLLGRGLFNPRSQIAIRMLTRGDSPVDDAYWRTQLDAAVRLRRQLRLDELTDAYRLVHSEGDGLSGLIVERYADCLVFEFFALGMYQRWATLTRVLSDVLGPATQLERPDKATGHWHVFGRADGRIENIEGFRISPREQASTGAPERITIREHEVRYRVDVRVGHKTGFFCDQRDNRRRLSQLCQDADVLDLCCYTGGFSLCAAKCGGARDVIGVDLDESAVALAQENANLNQLRVQYVYADGFTYVRQMLKNRRQFDVVVLDPPKLVNHRSEHDEALRKYHDFNALVMQVVRPGGVLLTCSCSGLLSREAFRGVVQRASYTAGRRVQRFDETGAAPDHPVMANCPESEYLKAQWLRVL